MVQVGNFVWLQSQLAAAPWGYSDSHHITEWNEWLEQYPENHCLQSIVLYLRAARRCVSAWPLASLSWEQCCFSRLSVLLWHKTANKSRKSWRLPGTTLIVPGCLIKAAWHVGNAAAQPAKLRSENYLPSSERS